MRLIKFTTILLLSFCLFSCTDNKCYEKVLGGKHELRKFNVKTTTSSGSSGWYFLVMGGYSSSSATNTTVRFYFLNYKGEYQLKEMYLNNVNIHIDSTATIPYVKFYWIEHGNRDESEWKSMYLKHFTNI